MQHDERERAQKPAEFEVVAAFCQAGNPRVFHP
jgi:hypothetical protein